MQSVWLIILRSGNTSIKWLEMILRIKAQKKFIIFAFKKLYNATYGIFETGYGFPAQIPVEYFQEFVFPLEENSSFPTGQSGKLR